MTYVLCFLAWCFFTARLVSGQTLIYGLQGQETSLKTDITEQPDNILWKHNGNKVIEFNGNEEQVYTSHKQRVVLDWGSAELQIKDLRYEDSGIYVLEIYHKKDEVFNSLNYNLEVIGKVSKPTISCEMNKSSSDTAEDRATLTCSADPVHPPSLMKFEWISPVKLQPGHQLTISLEGDEAYTCRVSNPLTFESVTFRAKDCHSGESSLVALVVSISVVLLFLLLGLLVFLYYKRKVCFANRDDEPPSDLRKVPNEENEYLIDRNPTFLSRQQLPQTQESYVKSCDVEQEPGDFEKKKQFFENQNQNQSKDTGLNRKNERPASPLGIKKEIADPDPDPYVHAEENANASSSEEAKDPGPADEIQTDVKQTAAPEEPGLNRKNERPASPLGRKKDIADADPDPDPDPYVHAEENANASSDAEEAKDPGPADEIQTDVKQTAASEEPVLKANLAAKTKPPVPVRPVGLTGRKQFDTPGNLPSNHKGKADTAADAHANADSPDTQKENDSDPAEVLEVQTAAAPEEPELKKKADENEDANTSAANVSSPPAADLTQNSETEDAAGEHENDAKSDDVNNETSGENGENSKSLTHQARMDSCP